MGATATDDRPTADEIRSSLLEQGDKLRELRAKKTDDRGDTWVGDVRAAIDEINHLDALLVVAERSAKPEDERAKGPHAAMYGVDYPELRTPGQLYTGHEAYKEHGRYTGGNLPDIEVNNLIAFRHAREAHEVRALLSTEQDDPAGGLWMPRGTPLPPQERRQRLFIRDVLAVVPTTLNSVPYIRELSPATNETGATAVAEGEAKPEVTMQFVAVDAPIRKIAAWIPVTTEIVEDAPTLRGYIDTRLGYMLALREEAQVLDGPGTAPNLRGILNTTGLQTQTAVAGDYAATIGRAIGKIEEVDGEADFLALKATDFWLMVTTRFANQLDVGFTNAGPFGPPPMSVWGLTAIRSRAIASGTFLVGSGRLGATIFDREQTVIRVGNQHADYFINNKLVILAEERIGLAVHRPDFFVEGAFT
jgi:HK97 family phage major capsid protein